LIRDFINNYLYKKMNNSTPSVPMVRCKKCRCWFYEAELENRMCEECNEIKQQKEQHEIAIRKSERV